MDYIEETERMLEAHWQWCQDHRHFGIVRTPLQRIIEDGGFLPSGSGDGYIAQSDDVAEVERVMVHLVSAGGEWGRRLVNIVNWHFAHVTHEQRAEAFGISVCLWKNWYERAKHTFVGLFMPYFTAKLDRDPKKSA